MSSVPGDHSFTKMVPKDTKMHPQVVKMEPPGPSNHCFSNPASHQLLVDRGAGGRGEALRFAAPPKGEPGVNGLQVLIFCRLFRF